MILEVSQMIKAIFFDIDGTLLSHRTRTIPQSTQIALKRLRERGIYTFIATGRHISEMKDLPLDNLEFDGYITEKSIEGIADGVEKLYLDAQLREQLVEGCKQSSYGNADELQKLYSLF